MSTSYEQLSSWTAPTALTWRRHRFLLAAPLFTVDLAHLRGADAVQFLVCRGDYE